MKIFNIIYFLVGYPYFLVLAILSSFIGAAIQAHLAYKQEKFPWQVSMHDAIEYIDSLQEPEE